MEITQYIAAFFAGAFLANAIPHFVHGISGDKFPTPFAKPPGKGLSSSLVNVVWSLVNVVIGYLLFNSGKVADANMQPRIIFFLGVIAMSVMLSIRFQSKHKE